MGPHKETDLGTRNTWPWLYRWEAGPKELSYETWLCDLRSLRTSDRPDDSKATPLRTTSFTSAEVDGAEYDRLGNTSVLEINPGRIYLLFDGL